MKQMTLVKLAIAGFLLAGIETSQLRAGTSSGPPPNDNFANAISLGSGANATATPGISLDFATVEDGEPLISYDDFLGEYFGTTVWWTWTCPAASSGMHRRVTISTAGSTEGPGVLDTVLGVFKGTQLNNLALVAENDESPQDSTSLVSFVGTPGTTYQIQVNSYSGSPSGSAVHLAVTSIEEPLDNDFFADAISLGSGNSASAAPGTTLDGTTVEGGEPFLAYDDILGEDYGTTRWWTWTCPAGTDRLVTITTAGSTEEGYDPESGDPIRVPLDTLLMIFTGDDLAALSVVAESDDAPGLPTSLVSFVATPGVSYKIRVNSFNGYPNVSDVKLALTSAGSPITAADHVAWGKALMTYTGGWTPDTPAALIPILTTQALNAAGAQFQQALVLDKANPDANVLNAIVSLMKLQKEPEFATLLTQIGVQDSSSDPEHPNYFQPKDGDGTYTFTDGALTTHALDYLKTVARPRLQIVVAMLEKVTSQTFLTNIPDHTRLLGGSVYLDYGDVVMLRSGCKALLGMLDLLETYNLAAPLRPLAEMQTAGQLNKQNVLDTFGSLLKLSTSDKRASMKTNLQAAITLYNQGSTYIRTKRLASQDDDHLFPLLGDLSKDADTRANLDKLNKALGGTTVTKSGWSFNLTKLMAGTLSLRDISPNFKGSKVIKGSLPSGPLASVMPGSSIATIENYLRDQERLYEGMLDLGFAVAPGYETFGIVDTPGGSFQAGSTTLISATANPGYVFGGWKFNDLLVSGVSPFTLPVIREYSLLAFFNPDTRDDDHDGLSNYDERFVAFTDPNNPDSDGDGWPDGVDANPNTVDAHQFMVSQDFAAISLALSVGKITAAAGLPPGVTFDAAHQRLVGRPSAITGASKAFTIKLTVKPTTGANYTLSLPLTVYPMNPNASGTFNGLVDADTSPFTINHGLGGSFNAVITSGGGVTAKIVLGGKACTMPAGMHLDIAFGSSTASCTAVGVKIASRTNPVTLTFIIDLATGKIGTGKLKDPISSEEVALTAERCPFSTALPATAYMGTYNAALTPAAHAADLDYPQGTGFATVKVANTGVVTWGGKLADGSAITGGTTVNTGGKIPLHVVLYASTGSIQGWNQITGTQIQHLTVPLNWTKKPQTAATRSYKAGFPTVLTINLDGSLYPTAPAIPNLFNLLGLSSSTNNVTIDFDYGNIANFGKTFTITTPAKVSDLTTNNPNKVTFTFTASTGLFTGSFTYDTPARKADVSGAIIPHLAQGVGYFLLPQIPTGAETATTSPILSGRVMLGP